jgi:SPP1 gp7 family putative phage head morphogenesis protein
MANPLSIGFNVPFHQAIKAATDRGVELPDAYYSHEQGIKRQLAFSIAGIASVDQLQMVRDSLAIKLVDGSTFAEWKKDILENGKLNLPAHRLENIYRTNLQGNYNRGRWQRFQSVKSDMPYLMYDAIDDSRVRPTHLAMDGIIRPIDDKFWDTHYPPNGYQCRCRCIALNDRQAAARSNGDNGLNKPVNTDDMQPDKGWDYNPGEDITEGIEQSIERRKDSGMPALFDIMRSKLKQQSLANNAMTKAAEIIGNIETASILELEGYLITLKKMTQTWFVLEEIARIEELIAND